MLEFLDLKQPLAMRELVSGKQQMRKRIKSTLNLNELKMKQSVIPEILETMPNIILFI